MPDGTSLLRDFAIIMAVAGAALILFRRLGQPAILGYLVAGFIIGPFVLPSFSLDDTRTIRLLADLGLVVLLFALGLEFGWERIRRVGLRVIFIGAVEVIFMLALGYEVATLLGWSAIEAIFLGSALSISSSAVLSKVLRDMGKLHEPPGRLIIGILVVEDFAAVILLSILSGAATGGATDLSKIGLLLGRLALFTASALVFGGLLAPRVIRFVAQFRSSETLLVASLALCFGLALLAHELGISGAAGAFLIGTVLGDTEHSEEIIRIVSPIRDMFAALFFVSIGMLVDLLQLAHFIGPVLIVSAVFIVGKVVVNTAATFLAGHDGRTSLSVGAGMPQVGEFSLAMVKVGADNGVLGSFLYPLVTATTAVTSLLYPFIFRSADRTADFLGRRSPRLLKHYVSNLTLWLTTVRRAFGFRSELARQAQGAVRGTLLNLGIVVFLIALGTSVVGFTQQLSRLLPLSQSALGLIIGSTTVALCVPPAVVMWRHLCTLADAVSHFVLRRPGTSSHLWKRESVRLVLRQTMLVFVALLVVVWSLPLIFHLLFLGGLSAPIPILVVAALVAVAGRAALRIHRTLEATFRRTFLGQSEAESDRPVNRRA